MSEVTTIPLNSALIPITWQKSSLVELSKFIDYRGKTPRKTADGIPLITAKNIRDGFINREPREFIAEKDYESWMTRGIPNLGDVVITTEAPMGNVANIDIQEKFALAQRAICLQFFVKDMNRFASYLLRSPDFQNKLRTNSTGTTVQGIKAATLKNLVVEIPPLAEQKQIATQLDQLLAQVDTLKNRLDAIPKILKRFRQSVLAAAVSGKLTEEWRGSDLYQFYQVKESWEHTVQGAKNWELVTFSNAVNIIGGSQPPKTEFRPEPFEDSVRLIQIRDYKSDKHIVYIPRNKAKRFCNKTDVMIGRYGPPIFQILRGLVGAYNVALMKAEPRDERIDLEYLYLLLQNRDLYNYIEAGSDRTAGQSGVNKRFLEQYPIFIPPIEEQNEIVRRVEQLFIFADQIEQRVKDAQSRVNHLTQSILAKAFRGELTAQWREDNPDLITGENSAEALLARIKKERAKLAPKKSTVKSPAKGD